MKHHLTFFLRDGTRISDPQLRDGSVTNKFAMTIARELDDDSEPWFIIGAHEIDDGNGGPSPFMVFRKEDVSHFGFSYLPDEGDSGYESWLSSVQLRDQLLETHKQNCAKCRAGDSNHRHDDDSSTGGQYL
jgi:hypothetical protein